MTGTWPSDYRWLVVAVGPRSSRLFVGLTTVVLTVGVGTVAAAPADRAAAAGKCYVGATGPIIKYPRIWAVGYFCSPTRRTDAATVILQGHIGGRWGCVSLAAGPPNGTIEVHNVGGRTYCIS